VFHHKVVFVYGTAGSGEENRWAFEKSRFDAERFWYQGNGSIEVVSDADFRAADYPESNVVLYGNAATNSAWSSLLLESPVQIQRGEIRFGASAYKGDDLACVVIRPRTGTTDLCVGAIGGSGAKGMRLTDRMPYLLPGVAFPDVVVARTSMLEKGEEGVEAAGFFGLDWSLESGEFERR
ncbi:MAG TPA: alpha/beta hydrolase, partial [Bacteroidota bacterium]|nr:alpha/beta hydrolase [Bacteroidota bacterium]